MTSETPVPKPRTCYNQALGPESPCQLDQSAASRAQDDPALPRAVFTPSPGRGGLPGGRGPDPGVGYPDVDPSLLHTGEGYPSLASVTDMISSTIPSLAGVAHSIYTPFQNPTPAPLGLDCMLSPVGPLSPTSPGAASSVDRSAGTTGPAASSIPDLESISSLLATRIPALAGFVGPAGTRTSGPSSDHGDHPSRRPTGDPATDVGALSRLVMTAALGPSPQIDSAPMAAGGVAFPSLEEQPIYCTAKETEWSSEDEGDADDPMEGFEKPPASAQQPSSNIPCRPPPPPPPPRPPQPISNQKTPRIATIRVSRKKQKKKGEEKKNSEVRVSSWLDMWKGFRHSVVWASLDGAVMSLWKKRTDKCSEMLVHVSSVSRVKRQEKAKFSVFFGKKRYEFEAHSDAVKDDWISALESSRGQPSPAPPQYHGPITVKDPRSRVYAAVFSRELWVYHSKEDYQVGVAWFTVHLNVASVKPAGKRGFNLITPHRTFSFSVDSTADLSVWQSGLSTSIRSAMSINNKVALRLWENPSNKQCGDCGQANPEWASINLLLLLCAACAGQHRGLGTSVSKVRSLTLDTKVWVEPLIQLFVCYGNRVANQIWSPAVPALEQLLPAASDEERSEFIKNKYTMGRYRKPHPLALSPTLLHQRLCKVVCGDDIEETMALLCSGAKLSCQSESKSQSPLSLAEKAGQTLQVELLRLNEYTEIVPVLPLSTNRSADGAHPAEEEEELHGKLEDDRFLFSLENDSAACDVLDLREVHTILLRSSVEFEMVSLSDRLICASDNQLERDTHLLHILQVILPLGVCEVEMRGVRAVSRVCLLEDSGYPEGWAVLNASGLSLYPTSVHHTQPLSIKVPLHSNIHYEILPNENRIDLLTAKRKVHLRFEDDYSCEAWLLHLKDLVANHETSPQPPAANQNTSLYEKLEGRVPVAVERCISHITKHGLQVDGIYRRCGLASKVSRLVEALQSHVDSAPMEEDEQGVLDVGSALKQYVRQQPSLFPSKHRDLWMKAAANSDEPARLASYRRLLRLLPADNRATLRALIGHFYMIQMYSSQNQMTAQNLALVLVPTLFQDHHRDLVRLTRDLIIHHTLLFMVREEDEEEEQITVF